MPKRVPNIVVVGSSNTDMVIKSHILPRPGETVLGGQFVQAAGGKGANQAVAAARLGAHVTFIARVGDDMLGEKALAGFREDNIDISYIIRDKEAASGVALILVDDNGENLISVAPGANARLIPADVDRAQVALKSADALLLQLETPIETVTHAATLAHQAGVKVILDPAPAVRSLPDALLKNVDILIPNETEAEILTGTSIVVASQDAVQKCYKSLRSKGIKSLILKAGSAGAWLVNDDICEKIAAPRVKAVDSTAAGDCFAGALATGLGEGMSLKEAVAFGCLAAAISVTRMGAQPSMPSRREVENFS